MSTTTAFNTITDTLLEAQSQALKLFKQSSETTARALETWSEFVTSQSQAFLPEGLDLSFFEPVAEVLPTPTKLVESTFSFAEELLSQQRELATKVATTAEGILGGARPVSAATRPVAPSQPVVATAKPMVATAKPAPAKAAAK